MNVLFNAEIREDLTGKPLEISCRLPTRALAITLATHPRMVDAKQLVATLRRVAELIEKEIT